MAGEQGNRMTIDYPKNNISGVTILCNVHFEDDCFLKKKEEIKKNQFRNFIKKFIKNFYSFATKDKNKEIEYYLSHFIYKLARELNLIPLEDTLITKHFKEDKPVGEGTTGIMILKTSHICYHTWNEERYMRLELSVCKEIDADLAVAFIYEYFGIGNIKFISREIRRW